PYVLGNFIDNHDNQRFVRLAIENKQDPVTRLKLALTYMYTAPGIPIVYYGTEIAMDGGNDPDNRRMMDFTDHELVSYISTLGDIRKDHPALTHGDLEVLVDKVGTTVFSRTYEKNNVIVAMNNTTEDQEIILTDDMLTGDSQLIPVFGDKVIKKEKDGYVITLPKESSEIFILEEDNDNTNEVTFPYWYLVLGLIAVGVIGFLIIRKKHQ